MSVQNIECQLAQGQINRYLSGDALSELAITQLEAHIAQCDECKAALHDKRSTLQHILGQVQPADEAPQEEPVPSGARKFLIDAIRSKPAPRPAKPNARPTHAVIEDRREPAPQHKVLIRPLIYSGALALVLIGMSTIMRDPTRVFGERAKSALATEPTTSTATIANPNSGTPAPKIPAPDAEPPAPVPAASNPAPKVEPKPESESNGTPPASSKPAATPAVSKPARTRQAPRRANRIRRPSPAPAVPKQGSGVRVYDAEGQAIHP